VLEIMIERSGQKEVIVGWAKDIGKILWIGALIILGGNIIKEIEDSIRNNQITLEGIIHATKEQKLIEYLIDHIHPVDSAQE
jgi:hypothetical protein